MHPLVMSVVVTVDPWGWRVLGAAACQNNANPTSWGPLTMSRYRTYIMRLAEGETRIWLPCSERFFVRVIRRIIRLALALVLAIALVLATRVRVAAASVLLDFCGSPLE